MHTRNYSKLFLTQSNREGEGWGFRRQTRHDAPRTHRIELGQAVVFWAEKNHIEGNFFILGRFCLLR